MPTKSKSILQLKAELMEKEMQRLILMSQLGLRLYNEKDIKKTYAPKFPELFEKLFDNAIEMARIESEIDLASPTEEEGGYSPFPICQPQPPKTHEEALAQCPQCNAPVRKTDAFCFACGAGLAMGQEEARKPPKDEHVDEPPIPIYEVPAPAEPKLENREAISTDADEGIGYGEGDSPARDVVFVKSEALVSEGSQLVAEAKKERQSRAEAAAMNAADKSENAHSEEQMPDAAAQASVPKAGRLRINPAKVEEVKKAEAKQKEEKAKRKRETTRKSRKKAAEQPSDPRISNPEPAKAAAKGKTRPACSKTEQSSEAVMTVHAVQQDAGQGENMVLKDLPNLRFEEDEFDDGFVPWETYGSEQETIDEIIAGRKTKRSNKPSPAKPAASESDGTFASGVLSDMVEKKKQQKGTWEESLATLETEIDPFAGLEKKRKRSFKQDLLEMNESTPSKTMQTTKVNDLEGASAAVICPRCGHVAEKGAPYCPECGKKL